MCENLMEYAPLYLSFLTLLGVFLIIKYVDTGKPKLEEIETEEDVRYVPKKPSRVDKDVNRFGRWKLTLKSGESKTVIGYLEDVLSNTKDVKRYKEIK